MNISLTPELEKFIQEKVTSGLYTSSSEVIRESLRLLRIHDDLQKQQIQQLKQTIDTSLEELSTQYKNSVIKNYEHLKNKIRPTTK